MVRDSLLSNDGSNCGRYPAPIYRICTAVTTLYGGTKTTHDHTYEYLDSLRLTHSLTLRTSIYIVYEPKSSARRREHEHDVATSHPLDYYSLTRSPYVRVYSLRTQV
ncbi:unnamed protein product [Laminaria digitata]